MTAKVFSIDTLAGIQRDGTVFDMNFYTDGQWVRFQRGRPRKMAGYKQVSSQLAGPCRGSFMTVQNEINTFYSGYSDGLQYIQLNNNAVGSGVNNFTFSSSATTFTTISGGSLYTNGTYTNVPFIGGSGTGLVGTFTVSGASVTTAVITNGGANYQVGDILTCAPSYVGNGIQTLGTIVGGSLYNNATYYNVPLIGGTGTGATANIVVSGEVVTSVTMQTNGVGYSKAVVTGSISYYTMTVTAIGGSNIGQLAVGQIISGAGITAGTKITALGTGTGGIGTYVISNAHSIGSTTITSIDNFTASGLLLNAKTGVISAIGNLVGGLNYTAGTYTSVGLSGGTGIGAIATIVVSTASVSGVTNLHVGSLYTNGTYLNVPLTGGTGTGATANLLVSGNGISTVTVTNGGSNYLINDTLSCAASSIGVGIATGSIANAGSGYTTGTFYNVPLTTLTGTGSIAYANLTVNATGNVSAVVLTSPGIGYAITDTVSVSSVNMGGLGSGFVYTVLTVNASTGFTTQVSNLSTGTVSKVTVTSAGAGYSVNDVLSAGATNIGGVHGAISGLGTFVAGTGYTNGTTTTALTGGSGTGATALVVISSGKVQSVTLQNGGNNYISGDSLSIGLGGSGFSVPVTAVFDSAGFAVSVTSIVNGSGFSVPASAIYNSTGFTVAIASITNYFARSDVNLWQFDTLYNSQGGTNYLLAHPGQNLIDISSTVNTPVLYSANNAVLTQLEDTSGANPTGQQIAVSGGVISLHPYIFVYGNDGLIKNCSAGNPFDWNSADANETNVATGKFVKGLPVRGGSNAPAGLFWSLDSLVRVSYTPTTISTGGSANTFYWRYDVISAQTSILSSQSVIEYDGIYYWIGTDRFLLYNGTVQEIPNQMNQNYFFDNLNYDQRQKVWVSKVTRFGEIWWYYPRGDSTECNDAIIYNIREKTWYDAGSADGARRSSGFYTQVFHYPLYVDVDPVAVGTISGTLIFANGSAYTNGTFTNVPLATAGNGYGAIATIIVYGGAVVSCVVTSNGFDYAIGDILTAPTLAGGSGFQVKVTFTNTLTTLWQHEYGTDAVFGLNTLAIPSFFETSDLGWVAGGPAQAQMVGDNKWLWIDRIEPDFIQSGSMTLNITGRPYAQSADYVSQDYTFGPDTNKIDMKEQRREFRLRFTSNVQGGDYQLGKILLNAQLGDVRGY